LKEKGGPDALIFQGKRIRIVLMVRTYARVNPEAKGAELRKQQEDLAKVCRTIQEEGWEVHFPAGQLWTPDSPCYLHHCSAAMAAVGPSPSRSAIQQQQQQQQQQCQLTQHQVVCQLEECALACQRSSRAQVRQHPCH
jgi:hypothetical protein